MPPRAHQDKWKREGDADEEKKKKRKKKDDADDEEGAKKKKNVLDSDSSDSDVDEPKENQEPVGTLA